MEGKECSQHTESQEDHREEDTLHFGRYLVLHDFQDIHRLGSGSVVDAQDTNQQEGRTTHQHQGQLHGSVFLAAASPHTNQQVHRNQSHFIEHEHGEQVG